MKWLATVLCFIASVGFAEIIPADRLVEWSTNTCGIPGGIPIRTNIFVSLTITNPANAYAQIQDYLNACTNNGVVLIPTGTFNITGTLKIPSGVTLRGSGIDKTFIVGQAPANSFIGLIYMGSDPGNKTFKPILSGTNKGSTTITLVGTDSTLKTNSILTIDQVDDNSAFIFGKAEDNSLPCNNSFRGCSVNCNGSSDCLGSTHHCSQIVNVIATYTNKTFSFEPPLVWDFTNAANIFYRGTSPGSYTSYAGMEDFTVRNTYANSSSITSGQRITLCMAWTKYCWIKNVKSVDGYYSHLEIDGCYRPEVRGCEFTNSLWRADSGGYGVHVNFTSSGLFEDNIHVKNRDWFRMNGSVGNAIMYNYFRDVLSQTNGVTKCAPSGGSHDGFPMMNLWEGNITYTPQFDDVHGGGALETLFRNWIRGPDPNTIPHFDNLFSPLYIFRWQSLFNIVGNVIGTPNIRSLTNVSDWKSTRIARTDVWGQSQYTTFAIGYTTGQRLWTNWDGADHWADFIVADNFDFVVTNQTYYNGASPSVLSNSYFYAKKPEYFGILKWPPIDPSTNNLYYGETNIPAGYRFAYHSNPPIQVLTISPQGASEQKPNCIQYTATVDFGSGVTTNVSSSSTWSVKNYLDGTDSTDASVTATGLVCISNAGHYKVNINAAWSNLTAVSTLTVTNTQPTPNTNPIVCNMQWWAPAIFGYPGCAPFGPPSALTNYMLTFKTSPECTVAGDFEGSLFFSDTNYTTSHMFIFSTNSINALLGLLPSPQRIHFDLQCTSTNGGVTVFPFASIPLGCNSEINGVVLWHTNACADINNMTVMY